MTEPALRSRRAPSRGQVRRRRLALAAVPLLALGIAWIARGSDDGPRQAGTVRLTVDRRVVAAASVDRLGAVRARRAFVERRPRERRVRRGPAVVTLRTDRRALDAALLRAVRAGGGNVELPEREVAAAARLPIVKQRLRNNCETAALSMLLAARDVRVDQLTLQRALPRSEPLDPQPAGDGGARLWGDPDEGFVGRPEGGGPAGGYGVYQGPIAALARARGVRLSDLTGRSPRSIYRRLLSGSPVMAWVGLSDGPYETWVTPGGRRVAGNFGEHTVVLTGIRGDAIAVNDPLDGTRKTWTRDRFEQMWARLGKRALGV